MINWARTEHSVRALVLIGSRARKADNNDVADSASDWDFQVLCTRPELFKNEDWVRKAGLPKPSVYVARLGRLGRVTKISSVFPTGELDIALLPYAQLWLVKGLVRARLHNALPRVGEALAELSMVIRPGFRVLKGSPSWGHFFSRVASSVKPRRLMDQQIIPLADAYICDFISAKKKIRRGELLAAQRWLHLYLAETNFVLLHELELRSGRVSYPDARRLEMLSESHWRDRVAVRATPDEQSLLNALHKSADALKELMCLLVGSKWKWPDAVAIRD